LTSVDLRPVRAEHRHELALGDLQRTSFRIVVNGARALDLVLSLRLELWPDVPVVFAAVDDEAAARMKSVPNVTGHIMRLTLRDMVSTARLVVPNLKQIVLVGDPLHVGGAVLAVEDPDLDLPVRDLAVDRGDVGRGRLGALADRLQERVQRQQLQPERLGQRREDALFSADGTSW
jgi:hypothetical protein